MTTAPNIKQTSISAYNVNGYISVIVLKGVALFFMPNTTNPIVEDIFFAHVDSLTNDVF